MENFPQPTIGDVNVKQFFIKQKIIPVVEGI